VAWRKNEKSFEKKKSSADDESDPNKQSTGPSGGCYSERGDNKSGKKHRELSKKEQKGGVIGDREMGKKK
jgi:hypothetical protein